MVPYKFFSAALLFLCCSLSSANFVTVYEDEPLAHNHQRIRRFVRFMSRKPGPDAQPEKGIGFKGHLKNLLKGGTIGIEFHIPHVDRFGKRFWNDLLGNKRSVDKDEVDEGQDADEEEDEEESELEMENREENELDYVHLINPRVKDREP